MVDEERSLQFLISPDNVCLLSKLVHKFHVNPILKPQDWNRHKKPSRAISLHPHSDPTSTRNPRVGKVDELVRLSQDRIPLAATVAANREFQGKLVGLPHHFNAFLQVRITC